MSIPVDFFYGIVQVGGIAISINNSIPKTRTQYFVGCTPCEIVDFRASVSQAHIYMVKSLAAIQFSISIGNNLGVKTGSDIVFIASLSDGFEMLEKVVLINRIWSRTERIIVKGQDKIVFIND